MHITPFQLRKMIPAEEFDYGLLCQALSSYSGVRQKINEWLKSKAIIRVKKGLYVFGPEYNDNLICRETLANLIYGPSCISLEYALSYHGLIPERVDIITSVTPKRDKKFSTPIGHFSYRYLAINKYPHGIQQCWIDNQHPFLIASPEKALCDYIALNKIPVLKNLEEAENFLEFDLRIDRANLKTLKIKSLMELNKYYNNKNIQSIIEVL